MAVPLRTPPFLFLIFSFLHLIFFFPHNALVFGLSCPSGEELNLKEDKCVACNDGESSTAGASCENCLEGRFSASGDPLCSLCTPGTYSSIAGSRNCSRCDSYKFATSPGSSSCSLCSMGYFASSDGFECVECPTGSSSWPDQGIYKCTDCPAGTLDSNLYTLLYSTSASAPCMPCPTTSELYVEGDVVCSACVNSSVIVYTPYLVPFDSAKTTIVTASKCCSFGEYVAVDTFSCEPCPNSSYSNSTVGMGTSCKTCALAHEWNGGNGCSACVAGLTPITPYGPSCVDPTVSAQYNVPTFAPLVPGTIYTSSGVTAPAPSSLSARDCMIQCAVRSDCSVALVSEYGECLLKQEATGKDAVHNSSWMGFFNVEKLGFLPLPPRAALSSAVQILNSGSIQDIPNCLTSCAEQPGCQYAQTGFDGLSCTIALGASDALGTGAVRTFINVAGAFLQLASEVPLGAVGTSVQNCTFAFAFTGCAVQCVQTKDCLAFTFDSISTLCCLMKSISYLYNSSISAPFSITAINMRALGYSSGIFDYNMPDLSYSGSISTSNPIGCMQACSSMASCNVAVFYNDLNACHLKSVANFSSVRPNTNAFFKVDRGYTPIAEVFGITYASGEPDSDCSSSVDLPTCKKNCDLDSSCSHVEHWLDSTCCLRKYFSTPNQTANGYSLIKASRYGYSHVADDIDYAAAVYSMEAETPFDCFGNCTLSSNCMGVLIKDGFICYLLTSLETQSGDTNLQSFLKVLH